MGDDDGGDDWSGGWLGDDVTRFTGGRTQMCGEYPAGTHHFLSSLVLAPANPVTIVSMVGG